MVRPSMVRPGGAARRDRPSEVVRRSEVGGTMGPMDTDPTPVPTVEGTSWGADAEWTAWLATGVGLAVVAACYLVILVAYIRIIQKAGYSGWWVLVGLVPVLNLVMFLVFAYSRWPVLRENDLLRSQRGVPRS